MCSETQAKSIGIIAYLACTTAHIAVILMYLHVFRSTDTLVAPGPGGEFAEPSNSCVLISQDLTFILE